jgi:uncharacterized protein (DUF952 family)
VAGRVDERARVNATRIFHITSRAAWLAAQATGSYAADSLASEGFVHCSEAHQYVWVANRRFRGRDDLVLLHVDPRRLDAEVRYENLEGGEQLFPHVYGPIPARAVIEVTPLTPRIDGTFGD